MTTYNYLTQIILLKNLICNPELTFEHGESSLSPRNYSYAICSKYAFMCNSRGLLMKYDDVIYESNGVFRPLHVKDLSVEELETFAENGQFLCPGTNCTAKLCLVHSSKNGGRTCFLKAVDDESHVASCDYKNDNYREKNVTLRTDGIFTEKQVNDAVRRISNDYTNPIVEEKEPKKKKNGTGAKKESQEDSKRNVTAAGGRIVFGEDDGEGIVGRMRRRYAVSTADVGIMTTICGRAKEIYFNEHNEMFIKYADERLSNITVMLGAVYEHNNPTEFKNLYLAKQYFDKHSPNKDVVVAAGGLVNLHNGDLVLELQANGSLRINNFTIMKLAVNKVKEKMFGQET